MRGMMLCAPFAPSSYFCTANLEASTSVRLALNTIPIAPSKVEWSNENDSA